MHHLRMCLALAGKILKADYLPIILGNDHSLTDYFKYCRLISFPTICRLIRKYGRRLYYFKKLFRYICMHLKNIEFTINPSLPQDSKDTPSEKILF